MEDGRYRLRATARDFIGNARVGPIREWGVDASLPLLSLTTPEDGAIFSELPVVSGTASDAMSGVSRVSLWIWRRGDNRWWSERGWVPFASRGPLTVALAPDGSWRRDALPTGADLPPGRYTLAARAYDRAGNASFNAPDGYAQATIVISQPSVVNRQLLSLRQHGRVLGQSTKDG